MQLISGKSAGICLAILAMVLIGACSCEPVGGWDAICKSDKGWEGTVDLTNNPQGDALCKACCMANKFKHAIIPDDNGAEYCKCGR